MENKTQITKGNVVEAVETVEDFVKAKLGNPFPVDALLHSLKMVKKYAKESEQ